jgi:hypothetical protein
MSTSKTSARRRMTRGVRVRPAARGGHEEPAGRRGAHGVKGQDEARIQAPGHMSAPAETIPLTGRGTIPLTGKGQDTFM